MKHSGMIILVRHGQTMHGTGRCIGRTALPLSPEGQEQAENLAELLSGAGFARLCASPSGRAQDTLAPLAQRTGLRPDLLPELDEIDMGEWDGLPFDEIQNIFPDLYALRGKAFSGFRAPGGESFNEVAGRAMTAVAALAKGPLPVLAVTHAGVIRSVLCSLTGHPMDDLFHFSPENARCTAVRLNGGALELRGTDIPAKDVAHYL